MTCRPSVNQISVQRHAARGYALAAKRLGAPSRQFRPTTGNNPLDGALYAAVMATFNDDPAFSFKRPIMWDKPLCFGMFDTTDVFSGDLIVTPDEGTFFITRFEMFRPIEAVLCNAVVDISGTPGSGALDDDGNAVTGSCDLGGAQSDYGSSSTGSSVLAAKWPAWIGRPGRGSGAQSGVSGSLPAASFLMRLPLIPNFMPQPYMTVATKAGLRYVISGVSASQYGYECLMNVEQV